MTHGDVERSGRAISGAHHECAEHVQWHDEQCSLMMEQDGYSKETSKKARIEQLVLKLYSMLAATTSCRAKELVKRGLSERSGMIAIIRTRKRFGKTAGVAELSDVFQFQRTSPDSLEDKWLRWQRLMRQVDMTSWVTVLVRRSRLLVWERPRNELWNHTCVYAHNRPGQCCVQVWISTCERRWTRAVSPRQLKLVP